jgi:SAM-dependent methyltransferase
VFKKFLQQLRWKKLARQLRKPEGRGGMEVAIRMNTANEFLYDFTLDEMLVTNNQSILEIGFGNGKFFYKQFNRADNLRVTGMDMSEDMIRAAHAHNQEYLQQGLLTLVKGQSNKMPFPDSCFDNVFCINVAYFWEEPQDHLLEIFRVLKTGGRFYTTIRTPESMARMPFTQYGFRSFTEEEWKLLCHLNNLSFIRSSVVNEPDIQGPGSLSGIRSLCFVAEKKHL